MYKYIDVHAFVNQHTCYTSARPLHQKAKHVYEHENIYILKHKPVQTFFPTSEVDRGLERDVYS